MPTKSTKLKEEVPTNLQKTIKEEVVKKKKYQPPRPNQTVQTEPGDNRKYISNGLQIMNLPKIDTNDPIQVENRINEYFAISINNDMKPSVAGMALALGTERQTLWRWINGVESSKSKEVRDTLKRGMAFLNMQMEDYMQNGKINPVSGIFLMKNNMGYLDKQEVIVTPNSITEQTESTLLEESNLLPEN